MSWLIKLYNFLYFSNLLLFFKGYVGSHAALSQDVDMTDTSACLIALMLQIGKPFAKHHYIIASLCTSITLLHWSAFWRDVGCPFNYLFVFPPRNPFSYQLFWSSLTLICISSFYTWYCLFLLEIGNSIEWTKLAVACRAIWSKPSHTPFAFRQLGQYWYLHSVANFPPTKSSNQPSFSKLWENVNPW